MVDISTVFHITAERKVQFIVAILLLVQVILATDLELGTAKFKHSPDA